MLLTIVLILFALHVAAWLTLPATSAARSEHEAAPLRQGSLATGR